MSGLVYRNFRTNTLDALHRGTALGHVRSDAAIDLYFDVVLKATEWPTRDFSIKTLAKHLGFAWRDITSFRRGLDRMV